jgi:hypothetical protein
MLQGVGGDAMSAKEEDVRQNQKAKLALAIARGESVQAWAKQNQVPGRTARRWAQEPQVRIQIEAWRRRALDRAIGRMAGLAFNAAQGIATLAKDAESESIQLRAWRAIIADQMAVAKFANLENRILQLEERAREQQGGTKRMA